jgi:2-haloacid dehalogenase
MNAANQPFSKRVVFDIGNVLVRWRPDALALKVTGSPERAQHFRDVVCNDAFLLAYDQATNCAQAVEEWARRHPDYAQALRAFDARWMEALPGAIEENVAILKALKARGEKVYSITNYPSEKFDASRARFPFYDLFDVVLVSGKEKLVKPDPAIYHRLFERTGEAPADLIFVDDMAENIAAARACGMQTIHFVEGVNLARELAVFGLVL